MADKGRRKRSYKFTGKKHSKMGAIALCLAVLGLAALGTVVYLSFQHRGEGTIYLGSAGILSMAFSVVAVITAIQGLREDDTFKIIPILSLSLGGISALSWILIYIRGFL